MLPLHGLSAIALVAMVPPAAGAPPAPTDAIDAAAQGLSPVQIEDDIGQRQFDLTAITTTGCVTVLRGDGAEIRIDWSKAEDGGMSDGFIWVKAPPVQLAIVADVARRDQLEKLIALSNAMGQRARECRVPPKSKAK